MGSKWSYYWCFGEPHTFAMYDDRNSCFNFLPVKVRSRNVHEDHEGESAYRKQPVLAVAETVRYLSIHIITAAPSQTKPPSMARIEPAYSARAATRPVTSIPRPMIAAPTINFLTEPFPELEDFYDHDLRGLVSPTFMR